MDRTVIISAPSMPPDDSQPGKEEDLAATLIQNAPDQTPSPSGGFDEDLEATVVLNAGGPPVAKKKPLPGDDDLAATMVQGGASQQPAQSPGSGFAGPPGSDRPSNDDDLDATLIITPSGQRAPVNHRPEMPPGSVDDELDATLVETPRSANRPHTERPLTKGMPSTPSVPPQPPHADPNSGPMDDSPSGAPDQENDDDDIMEQTIIIRSDVKKE